jgi:hypothetical protein
MHEVIFTPSASGELIDAQDWYESEARGLGRPFRAEVEVVVERLSATPFQFPVVYKNVRRALLRRFPYALMFVLESDQGHGDRLLPWQP